MSTQKQAAPLPPSTSAILPTIQIRAEDVKVTDFPDSEVSGTTTGNLSDALKAKLLLKKTRYTELDMKDYVEVIENVFNTRVDNILSIAKTVTVGVNGSEFLNLTTGTLFRSLGFTSLQGQAGLEVMAKVAELTRKLYLKNATYTLFEAPIKGKRKADGTAMETDKEAGKMFYKFTWIKNVSGSHKAKYVYISKELFEGSYLKIVRSFMNTEDPKTMAESLAKLRKEEASFQERAFRVRSLLYAKNHAIDGTSVKGGRKGNFERSLMPFFMIGAGMSGFSADKYKSATGIGFKVRRMIKLAQRVTTFSEQARAMGRKGQREKVNSQLQIARQDYGRACTMVNRLLTNEKQKLYVAAMRANPEKVTLARGKMLLKSMLVFKPTQNHDVWLDPCYFFEFYQKPIVPRGDYLRTEALPNYLSVLIFSQVKPYYTHPESVIQMARIGYPAENLNVLSLMAGIKLQTRTEIGSETLIEPIEQPPIKGLIQRMEHVKVNMTSNKSKVSLPAFQVARDYKDNIQEGYLTGSATLDLETVEMDLLTQMTRFEQAPRNATATTVIHEVDSYKGAIVGIKERTIIQPIDSCATWYDGQF